ncbi:S8 family peptidase [Adhaeribacter radiodurans]|uniref:S8 family serine peptidase n=1 Tax=Adhaeribacter radiodurans TaxID=2745197 RepID=A0A7L7LBE6_9BACT|nr:S8 family serine peptidase [Adhaeribacter radiodurans]QMU29875.1 S8 family serine peptidase [Adhaeribacter radiodurans]
MKEKHIILRLARPATRDLFLGGGLVNAREAESLAAGVTVEIEEIERNQISTLSRHADVVAIAPAIPMKLIKPVAVEDVTDPTGQEIAWGVRAVGADTSPFTGSGIVVAVLDTGIDASHPAFAGVSIIQNDFTGEGSGDQHGHGTHCAGTIFGRTTENTRIGVAPGIEKALIGKVLGSQGGSSEQIVSGIQWAVDNGANIISMFLGMDFPGLVKRLQDNGFPTELATSRALEAYRTNVQLFERLVALINAKANFIQPTIVVAAAGNETQRDTNPDFEIAVSPPAVAEGIISVAALGEDPEGFTVAPFSNTGATVSGPGVAVLSAKMGGGFALMSGTSMATPHVAGVAALWAEKIKSTGVFSPAQLTARLISSGNSTGLKAGFDPFDIGAGLVRAPQL